MTKSRLLQELYPAYSGLLSSSVMKDSILDDEFLIRRLALVQASMFVGTTEVTQNRGPVVDMFHALLGYGFGHQWCSIFVHAVWLLAAQRYSRHTHEHWTCSTKKSKAAVKSWNNAASTVPFDRILQESDRMIQAMNPVRLEDVDSFAGWAFIRVRDPRDRAGAVKGSRAAGHAGIIESFDGKIFRTIEGNTTFAGESGDSANGGAVACKELSLDDDRLVGLIRPSFQLIN